jgi:CubicO group peptidase (beta-lactamase class C family)
MSNQTFMHIGYTGTCICIDPVNQLYTVILTTR